jgi:hypothetical protein
MSSVSGIMERILHSGNKLTLFAKKKISEGMYQEILALNHTLVQGKLCEIFTVYTYIYEYGYNFLNVVKVVAEHWPSCIN